MTEQEAWRPQTWTGISLRIEPKQRGAKRISTFGWVYITLAGLMIIGGSLYGLSGWW